VSTTARVARIKDTPPPNAAIVEGLRSQRPVERNQQPVDSEDEDDADDDAELNLDDDDPLDLEGTDSDAPDDDELVELVAAPDPEGPEGLHARGAPDGLRDSPGTPARRFARDVEQGLRQPTPKAKPTGDAPWWSKPREEMVKEAHARSVEMSSHREGRRHIPRVLP
jgi:hypothetical protein